MRIIPWCLFPFWNADLFQAAETCNHSVRFVLLRHQVYFFCSNLPKLGDWRWSNDPALGTPSWRWPVWIHSPPVNFLSWQPSIGRNLLQVNDIRCRFTNKKILKEMKVKSVQHSRGACLVGIHGTEDAEVIINAYRLFPAFVHLHSF